MLSYQIKIDRMFAQKHFSRMIVSETLEGVLNICVARM